MVVSIATVRGLPLWSGTTALPLTRPAPYTRCTSFGWPPVLPVWSTRRTLRSAGSNTTVKSCLPPVPNASVSLNTSESAVRRTAVTRAPIGFPWSVTAKLSRWGTSCAGSSGSALAFGTRSAGAIGLPSTSTTRTGAMALSASYSFAPSPATTIDKTPAWYRRWAAARTASDRTALSRSRYSRR